MVVRSEVLGHGRYSCMWPKCLIKQVSL